MNMYRQNYSYSPNDTAYMFSFARVVRKFCFVEGVRGSLHLVDTSEIHIIFCLQCGILTHTWHINISPLRVRIFVFMIHYKEPLSLPPQYWTGMWMWYHCWNFWRSLHYCRSTIWRKSNCGSENDTTAFSSKTLRLTYKILVNWHLIHHNILSLEYDKILARAWHGYPYKLL